MHIQVIPRLHHDVVNLWQHVPCDKSLSEALTDMMYLKKIWLPLWYFNYLFKDGFILYFKNVLKKF